MFTGVLMAATFKDDFNNKNLDKMWVVKAVGKASYEIKDGLMIQKSPGVSDGFNLCYNIPLKGDVTFEAKIDASAMVDEATSGYGNMGFYDDMIEPMANTDSHLHWMEVFYCNSQQMAGVINDGKPAAGWNRVIPHGPITAGWHVWRVEVKGGHAKFFIDGVMSGEGDNVVKDRYFIIGVDPYTSHYSGTWSIDYVELTGDSVQSSTSAVESSGKMAITWGVLKAY